MQIPNDAPPKLRSLMQKVQQIPNGQLFATPENTRAYIEALKEGNKMARDFSNVANHPQDVLNEAVAAMVGRLISKVGQLDQHVQRLELLVTVLATKDANPQ